MKPTSGQWEIDGFDLASIIVKHPSGNSWLKIADFMHEVPVEEAIANAKKAQIAVNNYYPMLEALKEAYAYVPDHHGVNYRIKEAIKTAEAL